MQLDVVRTWGSLPAERAASYPCDLIMMRKQLLNLKRLAEAEVTTTSSNA